MRGAWTLAVKEWRQFFVSPRAYIFGAMLLLLLGYFFAVGMALFNQLCLQASGYAADPSYAGMLDQLNVNEVVLRGFFGNAAVMLLFFIPAVSMRLWAEERRQGTVELLFTAPVTDMQLVLGKFLGGLLAVLTPLAVTGGYLGFVAAFAENPDWGPVWTGYLGLVLMTVAFLALGMAVSASTQNQIVAMVLTFGLLLGFYVVSWMSDMLSFRAGEAVRYLAILNHLENFTKGVVEVNDLAYFASVTAVGLALTHQILGARRWKG
jgi:ABC-2 type transport system permease protein